tara:strand:- start:413 stop:595 length:183 start_codon:yes stop_codon:yes gene_type:complete
LAAILRKSSLKPLEISASNPHSFLSFAPWMGFLANLSALFSQENPITVTCELQVSEGQSL